MYLVLFIIFSEESFNIEVFVVSNQKNINILDKFRFVNIRYRFVYICISIYIYKYLRINRYLDIQIYMYVWYFIIDKIIIEMKSFLEYSVVVLSNFYQCIYI